MDIDPRWRKVLEYIRKGHTRADACRLARIPGVVLRNAIALAKEGKEEYIELFEELQHAEAESVDTQMTRLDRAAEAGDFKAIRFSLEALRPERFRPQERQQAQTVHSHIVTDDVAKQQLLELAIKLISEDPKARQTLVAALEGREVPQLPAEAEIVEEDE